MGSILRRLGLIRSPAPTSSVLSASTAFEMPGVSWRSTDKPVAAVWRVSAHRRSAVDRFLGEFRVAYPLDNAGWADQQRVLESWPELILMVWGAREPPEVRDYATRRGIPVWRLEDGFIGHMLKQGVDVPLSMIVDRLGTHYDASRPSDLETLLGSYEFEADPALLETARRCLDQIRLGGLTKRNAPASDEAEVLYGPKLKPRVLVMGQVESRASAICSRAAPMTNAELVALAAREHPGAQIIYSPHPDLVAGNRRALSHSASISQHAEVVSVPMSLSDALYEVDRVYTLSSLGGFESLIYGVPVTTVGAPFYSGWGLTDDRERTGRRNRVLSLEALFAGAYLLYPRYLDPVTSRPLGLPEALEMLGQYRRATARRAAPEAVIQRMKLFDIATRAPRTPASVLTLNTRSVAVIADWAGALQTAKAIAENGRKVTLLCTDDAMANSRQMSVSLRDNRELAVSSIPKHFAAPLSALEASAVELTRCFSAGLTQALAATANGLVPPRVIDALGEGLQDALYPTAVRFCAAAACAREFDATLLLIRDLAANLDVLKSFLCLGADCHAQAGIHVVPADGDASRLFGLLESGSDALDPAAPGELRADFEALWKILLEEAARRQGASAPHIAVCGSITNENYAYAPASWKLIETLARRSVLPIVFHPASAPGASDRERALDSLAERGLGDRCTLHERGRKRYRERHGDEIFDRAVSVARRLVGAGLHAVDASVPRGVADIFNPRIARHAESLASQMMFVADATVQMERCRLVATSMDRTVASRILCGLAGARNIPTLGIQPQIMSASPRYLAAAVNRMGVIDSTQYEVYRALGTAPETLEVVGSVNYVSRLQKLDAATAGLAGPPARDSVLFAMQHSNVQSMIEIALALKLVAERHGLSVTVKPHPNQELPVMHKIKRVFAGSSACTVLSPESDTYAAIPRCAIIVGLSSNVLLESAISGRPVIVAAFSQLHPSIDFSRLGLALKANDAGELEHYLLDIISDGPHSKRIAASRGEYLRRNPQFSRPYSNALLESFIGSAAPA